jgi:hypothetical protein
MYLLTFNMELTETLQDHNPLADLFALPSVGGKPWPHLILVVHLGSFIAERRIVKLLLAPSTTPLSSSMHNACTETNHFFTQEKGSHHMHSLCLHRRPWVDATAAETVMAGCAGVVVVKVTNIIPGMHSLLLLLLLPLWANGKGQ